MDMKKYIYNQISLQIYHAIQYHETSYDAMRYHAIPNNSLDPIESGSSEPKKGKLYQFSVKKCRFQDQKW